MIERFFTKVKFKNRTQECVKVRISGKDYTDCCNKSEVVTWSREQSQKLGDYAFGKANTQNDPFLVERTGKLGELAFAAVVNIKNDVDYNYKKNGDGGVDFALNYKIDLKVATKRQSWESSLIRSVNERGVTINLKSDIYVAGYKAAENKDDKWAEIILTGYLTKDEVNQLPNVPARRGEHKNKEMTWGNLRSMKELLPLCIKQEPISQVSLLQK